MSDTKKLAITRYELMIRGYCRGTDIARFVPCSRDTSYLIFKEIRKKNKLEGLENLRNVVLTKKVMKYIGLTESDVRKEYERYGKNE